MLYRQLLNELVLSDTIEKSYSAGTVVFKITFSWCTENQEQYDALNMYTSRLSKNDPLYKKGEPYDRVYDYIDWYMQFYELSETECRELLKNQEYLPKSLTKYDFDNELFYTGVLKPRIDLCKTMYDYRLLFRECGVWLCTVDYGDDRRVARVIPGGWACNQDDIFRFRFTSTRENIGYDDLQYTTLEVYVK